MNSTLEAYIPIANLIAETFGKHCEVIIHDFSMPQNSVVYTLNNTVTKRKVGQSFTGHFINQVLLSRKFHNDCSTNYIMEDIAGKRIKSSTALIRDSENKVVGALCVNIDTSYIENMINQLAELAGVSERNQLPSEEIEVISNIKEIVDDIIDKTIGNQDVSLMTREQKIEIIGFFNEKGIFSIKGSVDKIADKMNISKVTVYSYLDDIKKNAHTQT